MAKGQNARIPVMNVHGITMFKTPTRLASMLGKIRPNTLAPLSMAIWYEKISEDSGGTGSTLGRSKSGPEQKKGYDKEAETQARTCPDATVKSSWPVKQFVEHDRVESATHCRALS
ncbi:hypothetical protein C0991_009871 [Blastosporella zonata]|nr:hypothetical protein C0991_009871 [Blastosporella zonata]